MDQTARAAIVQWEQKPFPTVAGFLEKLASVLDEILPEKADIALFPEHLSWSISTACAFKGPEEALRHLAGFWRVRHCSQARAIENECFVVTAGNVGLDPQSPIMDENWASSAILTPSDIFFKQKGVLVEMPPNEPGFRVETLDFSLLEKQQRFGTVRTMADRRTDLKVCPEAPLNIF